MLLRNQVDFVVLIRLTSEFILFPYFNACPTIESICWVKTAKCNEQIFIVQCLSTSQQTESASNDWKMKK